MLLLSLGFKKYGSYLQDIFFSFTKITCQHMKKLTNWLFPRLEILCLAVCSFGNTVWHLLHNKNYLSIYGKINKNNMIGCFLVWKTVWHLLHNKNLRTKYFREIYAYFIGPARIK